MFDPESCGPGLLVEHTAGRIAAYQQSLALTAKM